MLQTSVPEFIDPIFAKTSPKRSFPMTENERFGLVFAKTGSINSGTVVCAGILGQSMGAKSKNRVGIGLLHRTASAGILKQSMGARNRVGKGLSYWLVRLHSLAELVPWNRFLGSLKV
jgi:hypothetical protein